MSANDTKEFGLENPAFVSESSPDELDRKHSTKSTATIYDKQTEVSGAGDVEAEENGPERQQWSSGLEFLMSCIAMSVGLGNVWRFPFTAYENGGGAFLIPYIIVLIIIGKPLYYLEMGLGQFTSSGCVKIWNMVPALRGLGYGQIFATILVLTYYCSLMAITAFYLFASFTAELPWAHCQEEWGENCINSIGEENTEGRNRSSSELYFLKFVLNEPLDIEDGIGFPEWRLTLCMLLSWIVIYLVIVRGVKGSGKAAYFLAIFPYVVLIALLIRGATLPGAGTGVLFFITPEWEELLNPSVWYAAVSQAFFSLNVCFGSLIVYSSYNDFNHNIYRDAMIVTTLDTFTSLLAGCTIFSILGNLAHELQVRVDEVVRSGAGLAFISYPDAIAKFEAVPQLFAVLFFFMLFVLGVGSAVALTGAIITIICDQFPHFKFWIVATVICIIGFFIGLVYITPGGQFILNLVDSYAVTYTVFVLACVETSAIAWIYGVNNICEDLEFMTGKKIGWYWRLCWGFLTPVVLLVILIYAIVIVEPLKYSGIYYPDSAYASAYVVLAFGILQFPIWVGYNFFINRHLPFREIINISFKPNELWRPKNNKHYLEWKEFKENIRRAEVQAGETMWRRLLRKYCACGSLDVPS